ncbi:uncharacterized protein H6S33_008901 [Morchella sextelata]|uniref:uncharacterized protein n=1 Tax=Morchella sextelata TaxID=1174677 RepID=UPI001D043A86|nr:uncharacterized protein H6S33_008901 [Morchella sextelata]KAH0612521.1 hypothetical protein H6S33_008901 [Morchella sextelata]
MNNFQFTVDGQIVDLDTFVPEERHLSPNDPAYALMDLYLGDKMGVKGSLRSSQSSHTGSHRSSQSGYETSGSKASKHSSRGGYETGGSAASGYPGSRTPTVASNRTSGVAGYLEAPPSQASHHSNRSYGSEHSTIRGEPSVHSHVSSRHTEIGSPSVHSRASSRHTEMGSPSVHSHASSRHTDMGSRTPTVASNRTAGVAGYLEAPPSHASHHSTRSYGSEHSTIRGEPSIHSHASSRHTEAASPSIHPRHTEAHAPSHISHAASRRTEVYSPSHISRSNTHHSSSRVSAAPSIKRSSTGTLSGYDTVGPEDSISSVESKSGKSRASRR